MSWKHLYATSRDVRITQEQVNLGNVSLHGGYHTAFWNNGQFADYARANIVKLSMPITDDRYIGKVPVIDEDEQPTGDYEPKLTRFVMLRYSDIYTNAVDLTASIEKTGGITGVQVFANDSDAAEWIRKNTNLEEPKRDLFIIRNEYVDMMGVSHPAEYLDLRVTQVTL